MTIDPSTWQPLKTKYAVFTPQAEIFQAGGSPGQPSAGSSSPTSASYGDGTNWNSFYENGTANYQPTTPFITGSQTWEKSSAKISVAADLTGDGMDNIVVFFVNKSALGTLNDIVYSPDPSGSGSSTTAWGQVQQVSGVALNQSSGQTVFDHQIGTQAGMGKPWFPYFSCTKADLNGDGKDEILLADYETLYELSFDPISGVFTEVTSIAESSPISSVAAGDYNGSGKDDFIVGLYPDQYILYNSQGNSVTQGSVPYAGTVPSPVEAAFGNFEGNGLDELALCVQAADGGVTVVMYDFPNGQMSQVTHFEELTNPFPSSSTYDYRMLPRAIDIDGSGSDALFVLSSIYKNPMGIPADTGLSGEPAPDYKIGPNPGGSSTTIAQPLYNTDNTIVDVQVGVTGLGGLPQKVTSLYQDLVVLSVGGDNVPDINVFGLDSTSAGASFVRKEVILWPLNTSSLASIDDMGTSTCIAVGNFENNSPRVEYVGHTLTFTNPVVIAALASPPYWSSIVNSDPGYQNSYSGWNTTFGETTANSTDTKTSVGFKVGAEVKFEDDVDIFGIEAAQFETSVAFTNTNTWEWDQSFEVAKSIQYNCPGGENLVVFTAVPEDQYQYKVVATTNPDTPVGGSLYIVIPRAFNTYVVTQAFFNSHINTSIVLPISNSVFGTSNFTIGDPMTYPSPSLAQTIMNSAFAAMNWPSSDVPYYQIGVKPVAEGTNNISGGSTNLQIAMTTGTGETISHDFEMDTSVGGGAGGVSVLANAGFQTGYSMTNTVNDTTTFGGTVGYLPDLYYNNPGYNYSAGLFVYPYKQPNGTAFWVVDYDVPHT